MTDGGWMPMMVDPAEYEDASGVHWTMMRLQRFFGCPMEEVAGRTRSLRIKREATEANIADIIDATCGNIRTPQRRADFNANLEVWDKFPRVLDTLGCGPADAVVRFDTAPPEVKAQVGAILGDTWVPLRWDERDCADLFSPYWMTDTDLERVRGVVGCREGYELRSLVGLVKKLEKLDTKWAALLEAYHG